MSIVRKTDCDLPEAEQLERNSYPEGDQFRIDSMRDRVNIHHEKTALTVGWALLPIPNPLF